MTTATALVPIVKTRMACGLRHGGSTVTKHRECWQAQTTDGVWVFDRLDGIAGTPWICVHLHTGHELRWFGSLRASRMYVGSGEAAADLERILSHERGEHETCDPRCVKC